MQSEVFKWGVGGKVALATFALTMLVSASTLLWLGREVKQIQAIHDVYAAWSRMTYPSLIINQLGKVEERATFVERSFFRYLMSRATIDAPGQIYNEVKVALADIQALKLEIQNLLSRSDALKFTKQFDEAQRSLEIVVERMGPKVFSSAPEDFAPLLSIVQNDLPQPVAAVRSIVLDWRSSLVGDFGENLRTISMPEVSESAKRLLTIAGVLSALFVFMFILFVGPLSLKFTRILGEISASESQVQAGLRHLKLAQSRLKNSSEANSELMDQALTEFRKVRECLLSIQETSKKNGLTFSLDPQLQATQDAWERFRNTIVSLKERHKDAHDVMIDVNKGIQLLWTEIASLPRVRDQQVALDSIQKMTSSLDEPDSRLTRISPFGNKVESVKSVPISADQVPGKAL